MLLVIKLCYYCQVDRNRRRLNTDQISSRQFVLPPQNSCRFRGMPFGISLLHSVQVCEGVLDASQENTVPATIATPCYTLSTFK